LQGKVAPLGAGSQRAEEHFGKENRMQDITPLHAIGFALYFVILLAGPVIWYRRGEAVLPSARRLGAQSDL
jgi:hypothetical protein